MLCARCGARNAEAATFCERCGLTQEKSANVSTGGDRREQPLAGTVGNIAGLPLDELPTSHVSSVADASNFAEVPQLPFSTDFSSEPLPGDDMTISTLSPVDDDATTSFAPPSRSGMLALPSQSKTRSSLLSLHAGLSTPLSQPGVGTPPEIAVPPAPSGQSGQPHRGGPPMAMRSPGQQGMYPMNMPPGMAPPPQMGMYTASAPAPAEIAGMSPQTGIAGQQTQPPQMGDPWQQNRQGGNYQAPVAPDRLGNVYPGPLDRSYRPMSQPGTLVPAGQSTAEEINTFVQPLPRRVVLAGPLVAAVLLMSLIFINPDWATGAIAAALVAITLAILLGIAVGVRVALGMWKETNPRRNSQMISSALLVLLLLLFSGIGISQQNNLHMMQGHYLEGHQSWASAITEYIAAGEKSSASMDVARTYDEWGEAQNSQQQYAGAVTSFNTVLQNYQGAQNEFNRAKTGIVTAYLGWADQAARQQNYVDATNHYNALLSLAFCVSNCKQLAQPKDATAYYHLAEQRLVQQQYAQAVDAYQTLQNRFPTAPEVGQIHAHYAQALWGKGQQEVDTACSDAVTTYRLLTKFFADTSQGKQAAISLARPVQVKGHFTQSIPGAPNQPTAYLVQGLFVGIQQYQFPPLLANAPVATIHSDGTFTFASVPQGAYELVWSSDNTLHFYYAFSGQHILYAAHLGPLCTYNYGDINQAIPTK